MDYSRELTDEHGASSDRSALLGDVPQDSDQITRAVARHIQRATYDTLAPHVVDRVKRHLTDAVGCAVGAHTLREGRELVDFARTEGGSGEVKVIGSDLGTTLRSAVWANASLINTLDFDDVLYGHPGATVVGAALTLADAIDAPGRELIAAIAVGYDVSLRVSRAIDPTAARWRVVTSSATPQTIGAAAAASRLLGLDEDACIVALGHAASLAPVPAIRKYGTRDGGRITWLKNQYGQAAAAGVTGALLAARGIRGPLSILDGERGFWIMAGSDRFDAKYLTEASSDFEGIVDVALKPYPCCRFFHAAIDGATEILEASGLGPEDVDQVNISSVSHLATFMHRRPSSGFDAEFSLPHAIAATLLGRPPGLEWFDETQLVSASMQSLMDAVTVSADPVSELAFEERQSYPTTVTITTHGGRHLKSQVLQARGHPTKPLSAEEVHEKFSGLTAAAWTPEKSEQVIEHIASLERQSARIPIS